MNKLTDKPQHPRFQRACHGLLVILLLTFFSPRTIAAQTPSAICEEISQLIASSSREGQESDLKKARAQLKPLLKATNPSERALLLNATILQRDHHFEEALVVLKRVLQMNPKCTEAWLIQSTIQTVMGRYSEARKSALPLFPLASPLVAMTAATAPSSLNGSLQQSYDLLEKVANTDKAASNDVRVWALGSLAEMSVRLGKEQQADQYFEKAHQLDRNNPWLTRTFADHLLNTKRPGLVLKLIKNREDHYRLHWLLATRTIDGKSKAWRKALATYRSAQNQHGHGHHHGREAARFQLDILGKPHAALHAIEHEIKHHREPADLLIALRSAHAAGNHSVIKELSTWVRTQKLEDVRLAKLLASDQK